jgi:hypothetical protein
MATWQEATARVQPGTWVYNTEFAGQAAQGGAVLRYQDGTYTVADNKSMDNGHQSVRHVPEAEVDAAIQQLNIANSDWA